MADLINLKTEFPIAVDSLDHLNPYGVLNDNNSNGNYIEEVRNHFQKTSISVLDIGCAGGQIVVDHLTMGDTAVGIEGSDNVLQGSGSHNWKNYKDKNLFLCDASRPFSLYKDTEKMCFDYIQTWEVLEHIPEDRLNVFLANIRESMGTHSIFCGSISLNDCISGNHVSVFPIKKWCEIFNTNGLSFEKYIFQHTPRSDVHGSHCILFTSKII